MTQVRIATLTAVAGLTMLTATAPANAASITPNPQRTTFSIAPWQRVDLAFPIRITTRTSKQMRSVKASIYVAGYVIRKRGLSFPISRGRYVYGRDGSGVYTITIRYAYATSYRDVPRYGRQKQWTNVPVTCTLQGEEGQPLTATEGWLKYSDSYLYRCTNPDGSPIVFGYQSGEALYSDYFAHGYTSDTTAYPAEPADGSLWWPFRTPGNAPCANGFTSSDQRYFCPEDISTPPVVTASWNKLSMVKVVKDIDRNYINWHRSTVRQTYRITVK